MITINFGLLKVTADLLCKNIPITASIIKNASVTKKERLLKEWPALYSFETNEVVRPVGIEPTTNGFEIRYSIQLSYGRIKISKKNCTNAQIDRNIITSFKNLPKSFLF